jgi:hypothetical protein
VGVLSASAQLVTHTVLSVPALLEELLVVAVVVACFVVLHAVLQRRLRTEMLRRHNDVAGYLFQAVGVLFAVVLGFVVIVVWQKYDDTVSNVETEVNAVGDLYHSVDAFNTPERSRIRSDLRAYAQAVVEVEWPAMARNEALTGPATELLDDASYRIDSFSPTNFKQFGAQQAAIADERRLFDARRSRIIQAAPAVPIVLWFALIAGALAMVAFCYIFGVENRPAQLFMTAILVGLIGILFVVVAEFSTPFSGSVSISPDGWLYLQQRLPQIQ